ncbi:hypothetical protein EON66_03765, partial [archaeon]
MPIDIAEAFASQYTMVVNNTLPDVSPSPVPSTLPLAHVLAPGLPLPHSPLLAVERDGAQASTSNPFGLHDPLLDGDVNALPRSLPHTVTSLPTLPRSNARAAQASPEASAAPSVTPNAASNGTGNATAPGTTEVVHQRRNVALEVMWLIVYWSTFVTTYVAIPTVQEYVAAGDFTPKDKLITATKRNLLFYGTLGGIGFIAFLYIIFGAGFNIWELFPLVISIANTYGLIYICLLMGYGAAEVPRFIWRLGDSKGSLKRAQFKAPELEAAVFDAQSEMDEVLADLKKLHNQIQTLPEVDIANVPAGAKQGGSAKNMVPTSMLRKALVKVLSK